MLVIQLSFEPFVIIGHQVVMNLLIKIKMAMMSYFYL